MLPYNSFKEIFMFESNIQIWFCLMKLIYMTIFEEQVVCKKENIHSNITWLINEIHVYSVWHLYELFTFYSQKVNEKVNFAILIINIVMSMNIMQQK